MWDLEHDLARATDVSNRISSAKKNLHRGSERSKLTIKELDSAGNDCAATKSQLGEQIPLI